MENIKNFASPQKLPYEPTGLEEMIAHTIHRGLRLFEVKNLEEISEYKYAVHPDGILVYDEKAGLLWFENFCSDEVPISIEGKFDNIELYFDHVRVIRNLQVSGRKDEVFSIRERIQQDFP